MVKRAFKYRFYPTAGQAVELARTFGCVRLVYNMALQARSEAWILRQERVNYNATSALLTGWKRTEELAFLNEVSSVPLQQALRHLQVAFTSFFAKRARYPTFKSRKRSRRSAEYTTSAFRYREGRLILAKMAEPLDIVWSRPLPEGASPSTVTVSQCGQAHDCDVNAARNILAEGLSAIACGGGVRPQRESSRTGRSSVKQETQRATAGIPRL
ncbi:RNA-guided endonuclease InsQ/TnpB family protein [Dactylosporangium sp. CA-152071]|uniref:RNA-guided endonuclease InsQ/TnpB family protein n=1 Tax=Dactylosporangium sp. CA-152071 TaxID=3239933 RepID=UPI003D9162A3